MTWWMWLLIGAGLGALVAVVILAAWFLHAFKDMWG